MGSSANSRDDLIYRAALMDTLSPYIEAARKWWADVENRTFSGTNTFPVKDTPPGFFEKCVRSPRQSPVYGVQAFPIVSLSYLSFPITMRGGAVHLVDHICRKGLVIEEFTVMMRQGINNTALHHHYLIIVPTDLLEGKMDARWVYMRPGEMIELSGGHVPNTLVERLQPFLKEVR